MRGSAGPSPLHPPPGRSVPLIQENKTDTSALSGDQEDYIHSFKEYL